MNSRDTVIGSMDWRFHWGKKKVGAEILTRRSELLKKEVWSRSRKHEMVTIEGL